VVHRQIPRHRAEAVRAPAQRPRAGHRAAA
jgi:hypothetical protein